MEFESSVRVAAPPAEVFDALADPFRLDGLTPEWIRFRVASPAPLRLGAGARVDYRLTWHGLPMRWRSRIRVWAPPDALAYEQERGPFRRFVHRQEYRPIEGGTLVVDRLEYEVLGGSLLARLLVAPDLRRLFEARGALLRRTWRGPDQPSREAESSGSA